MLNECGSQSTNFRQNVRSFNSSLAFASFGASVKADSLPGNGPYCFKVQGMIYHLRSNLGGIQNSNVANNQRINNNPKCDSNLLNELDTLFRNINRYSTSFKMLYELEKEEEERCIQNGEKPKNYSIRLIESQ